MKVSDQLKMRLGEPPPVVRGGQSVDASTVEQLWNEFEQLLKIRLIVMIKNNAIFYLIVTINLI